MNSSNNTKQPYFLRKTIEEMNERRLKNNERMDMTRPKTAEECRKRIREIELGMVQNKDVNAYIRVQKKIKILNIEKELLEMKQARKEMMNEKSAWLKKINLPPDFTITIYQETRVREDHTTADGKTCLAAIHDDCSDVDSSDLHVEWTYAFEFEYRRYWIVREQPSTSGECDFFRWSDDEQCYLQEDFSTFDPRVQQVFTHIEENFDKVDLYYGN